MNPWVRWIRDQAYLLLALAAAGATALFIYHWLALADRRVQVVVAAADIPEGQAVTADMLRLVPVHPSGRHPEALDESGDALGRFSLVPVHQGEQLLTSQLSDDEGSRGFLGQLGPGERAILVPVSLGRGLGGGVLRGDRVDVVFVASEQKLGRGGAATVLRGARVLDVRSDRGVSLSEPVSKGSRAGEDPGFLGVLLAVTSEDAEQIAFYIEHGQVFLVLDGYRADPKAGQKAGATGGLGTPPALGALPPPSAGAETGASLPLTSEGGLP